MAKKKSAPKKYLGRDDSDLVPLMIRVPRKKRDQLKKKAAPRSVNCHVNKLIDRDLAS